MENFPLNFNKKHPMILPFSHQLTKLIIIQERLNLLHAGTQTLLANLCQMYWPLRGTNIIKRIIHECVVGYRQKALRNQQLMGQLPSYRGEVCKVFANTGVDYGGPFSIKTSQRKNVSYTKAYVALFICLATCAIHKELVVDLSIMYL